MEEMPGTARRGDRFSGESLREGGMAPCGLSVIRHPTQVSVKCD